MRTYGSILTVMLAALLVAGCGGGGSSSKSASTSGETSTGGGGASGGGGGSGAGGGGSGGGSGGGGSSGGGGLPGATIPPPDCTTDCDFTGLLSDKNKHTPPSVSKPALHASYVDSTFGTTVYRISAASQISGSSRVRHYYSKQNPWNADESYLILGTDNGEVWLYDGMTYEPIKELNIDSDDSEPQWHPTNPDLLYYIAYDSSSDANQFVELEVSSNTTRLLHDFGADGYIEARGRLEGNIDETGRYYAMLGTKSGGSTDAFVYDIVNDTVSNKVNVTAVDNNIGIDWISVTPKGGFVVLMGDDKSRVYNINMVPVAYGGGSLPNGSFGHADLCVRADGSEVMVYDGADHEIAPDGDRWINMAILATGEVYPIAKIGWSTTPHVSCRNTQFPGWALISTQGDGSNNFDYEVYWVKLDKTDGTNEVRRVVHHHSNRGSNYFAEQHATVNKYGNKVLYASNYGSGEISSYLVDLTDFRVPAVE